MYRYNRNPRLASALRSTHTAHWEKLVFLDKIGCFIQHIVCIERMMLKVSLKEFRGHKPVIVQQLVLAIIH
jgi:hypothetical protein